jgi:hypothetical protein
MNEIERAAVAEYPPLQRLIALKAAGGWFFQPIHCRGGLELVAGSRSWPDGWSDAIAIRDETDAKAYRCNPAGDQVWDSEGGLADVIDALAELPTPGAPGAPRLIIAQAQKIWTPGR